MIIFIISIFTGWIGMMIGSAINESFINIGGILGMLLPYAVAIQSIHSKLYNEPKHQNDKSEIE